MDPLRSPFQPRIESPVLTYIQKDYEEEFKLPQALLDTPPCYEYTTVKPVEKKKRDPYSLVISKLVYMMLQHLNQQTTLGLTTYDDLQNLFIQRNSLIPLMTRQFCTFQNFTLALEHVRHYEDLSDLLDVNGLNAIKAMELNHVFIAYLRDDQFILRKFYTHVDLSRKKEKQQHIQDLQHVSKVWNNLSKRRKHGTK
eukprot:NODE_334_length_9322_cov_0.874458.p4 type:complete len:197 gc:universal NODE_334_length_9322_cov_0.874458:6834-7424(+)